ncbi:hypothetical protein HBI50_116750 [Parastagonospora nodorum]|nr:hypothetical protein HBI50_116750 [Parastagonospora nodorum]
MRPISTNNDLLRHEQQQRLSILRRILNCYIFAIMILLICDAMTLISDEYEILYAENSLLQSTAPNSRLRIIMHLAMRSERRKMRCNYNPETRLRNNNGYAEAVVYTTEYKDISSLNYTQFIRTLEREVRFKDKRSGIYYYTKIADSWTHTVATKLYRAIFVIELLI